MIISMTRVT